MDRGGNEVDSKESEPKDQQQALVELQDLVNRAKQGDRNAIPRLREYLDANPVLWKRNGDLALQAQAAWINLIAGDDRHFKECLARKANDLKQQLAGPSPTPVEAMAVERIVTTWLRVCYCDADDAQENEDSLKWAEFRLKRYKTVSDIHMKSLAAYEAIKRLLPAPQTVVRTAEVEPSEAASPLETKEQASDENLLPAKFNRNGHVNGDSHNRVAKLLTDKPD
jgi:hypothetical protein